MDRVLGKESLARALQVTRHLASEIGPRRPCSESERDAAAFVASELREDGVESREEPVPATSTFAAPYTIVLGLAVGAGIVPKDRRLLRSLMAGSSALLGGLEAAFHPASPLRRLARGESRNVIAAIEPREKRERTLCLVSHLDSSRSGLMFHPRMTPHLSRSAAAFGLAVSVQGFEPLLTRSRTGSRLAAAARVICGLGAILMAERELRGEDVAGANDNASGVGGCLALAAEVARAPLLNTRLAVLVTGGEESGVFGARSFIESRDISGWLFVNFDGIGAPAALHWLEREGGSLRSWAADPGLVAVAGRVAERRPDLGLTGTSRSSGLPYDATPILARGGRAITLTVQNGSIPNYHWPTDTADNLDPEVFERALGAGREMIAAIDRGEADL